MDQMSDLLHISRNKEKSDREPQSETEEVKGVDKFETDIVD